MLVLGGIIILSSTSRACSEVSTAVERTLAWLNRNRRLAKDFEATIESALSWLYIANVKLLARRLARQGQKPQVAP